MFLDEPQNVSDDSKRNCLLNVGTMLTTCPVSSTISWRLGRSCVSMPTKKGEPNLKFAEWINTIYETKVHEEIARRYM